MPGTLRPIVGPMAHFVIMLNVRVRGTFSPHSHYGSGCSATFLGGFEQFSCGVLAQGFEQSVVELCVVF